MNEDKIPQLLDDRGKLIGLIYRLLNDILTSTVGVPSAQSKFHAKNIPSMPVQEYLNRLNLFKSRSQQVHALLQRGLCHLPDLYWPSPRMPLGFCAQ